MQLTKRSLFPWVSLAALGAISSVALAQNPARGVAGPGASGPADMLQEVIVTAEKHRESAQKTAISMSVYSGGQLRRQGVTSIRSLTTIDPSINFTTQTGSAYVAIRGIASTDVTETGDPAVAISEDGFFTNRSYDLFASLFDLQQIEVLKGPQGTLYGRNAAGGVINIITQKPTKKFGGYLTADAGNYGAELFEGALNVPLGAHLQARISAESTYHQGYRRNPGFENGDNANNRAVRLQLAFQPWAGFDGWLEIQHSQESGTGDVAYTGPLGTSGRGVSGGVTPAIPYARASGFPLYAPFSLGMTDTRYQWRFIQKDLPGGLMLTYLGGYDSVQYQHQTDSTLYPQTANPPTQFIQNENPGTQNEEIRLTSAPDSRLFWQVGGFYFRERNSPLSSGLKEEGGPYNGLYLIDFHYGVLTTSEAGFGQVQYSLTRKLKVSAGLRYTRDHKARNGNAYLNCPIAGIPPFLYGALGCVGTPPTVVTPGNGNITESKTTYHLGINWYPTSATMVYAKYDTGYKAGGFNSNGSAPSVNYGPETVKSFEVGTKNTLLHHRLEADLSLFDMKYDGYQASQYTHVISGSATGVFNAGNADDYGAEGQIAYLLTPRTRFNLNATWLHAKFISGSAVDASTGLSTPLSGDYLPNAPAASATASLQHTVGLPNGAALTAQIDGKYQSRFYFDIFNHPDTSQRAYAMGDASLTYLPESGRWSVEGYVRNFSNEVVLADAARNPTAAGNNYEFQPPRTYGVRVTAHF